VDARTGKFYVIKTDPANDERTAGLVGKCSRNFNFNQTTMGKRFQHVEQQLNKRSLVESERPSVIFTGHCYNLDLPTPRTAFTVGRLVMGTMELFNRERPEGEDDVWAQAHAAADADAEPDDGAAGPAVNSELVDDVNTPPEFVGLAPVFPTPQTGIQGVTLRAWNAAWAKSSPQHGGPADVPGRLALANAIFQRALAVAYAFNPDSHKADSLLRFPVVEGRMRAEPAAALRDEMMDETTLYQERKPYLRSLAAAGEPIPSYTPTGMDNDKVEASVDSYFCTIAYGNEDQWYGALFDMMAGAMPYFRANPSHPGSFSKRVTMKNLARAGRDEFDSPTSVAIGHSHQVTLTISDAPITIVVRFMNNAEGAEPEEREEQNDETDFRRAEALEAAAITAALLCTLHFGTDAGRLQLATLSPHEWKMSDAAVADARVRLRDFPVQFPRVDVFIFYLVFELLRRGHKVKVTLASHGMKVTNGEDLDHDADEAEERGLDLRTIATRFAALGVNTPSFVVARALRDALHPAATFLKREREVKRREGDIAADVEGAADLPPVAPFEELLQEENGDGARYSDVEITVKLGFGVAVKANENGHTLLVAYHDEITQGAVPLLGTGTLEAQNNLGLAKVTPCGTSLAANLKFPTDYQGRVSAYSKSSSSAMSQASMDSIVRTQAVVGCGPDAMLGARRSLGVFASEAADYTRTRPGTLRIEAEFRATWHEMTKADAVIDGPDGPQLVQNAMKKVLPVLFGNIIIVVSPSMVLVHRGILRAMALACVVTRPPVNEMRRLARFCHRFPHGDGPSGAALTRAGHRLIDLDRERVIGVGLSIAPPPPAGAAAGDPNARAIAALRALVHDGPGLFPPAPHPMPSLLHGLADAAHLLHFVDERLTPAEVAASTNAVKALLDHARALGNPGARASRATRTRRLNAVKKRLNVLNKAYWGVARAERTGVALPQTLRALGTAIGRAQRVQAGEDEEEG